MARKEQFVQAVQGEATGLVRAIQRVEALARIYTSEGYAAGGADELTQADLVGTPLEELDVADVHALLSDMVPTLTTWLDTGARRATLDRLIEVTNL
jgi:hypothetical protein